MARLFTADVHAVLDRIEEPDVLLKHAVREMEEELARSEQRLRMLEHEHAALDERQRKAQELQVELDRQLDVCFDGGNEQLTRKVIRRRLETELLERHAAERRATIEKELAAQRTALAEQREQLDVMRQKAELLASPSGDNGVRDFAVGEAEVEVAFLREQQKRRRS
jgi:phage shock protein A